VELYIVTIWPEFERQLGKTLPYDTHRVMQGISVSLPDIILLKCKAKFAGRQENKVRRAIGAFECQRALSTLGHFAENFVQKNSCFKKLPD